MANYKRFDFKKLYFILYIVLVLIVVYLLFKLGIFSVSFYTGSVFFHIDSAIFKVSTEKTEIFTENCNYSVNNSISCNIFSFYKSFRLTAFRGNLQTFHKS